jgi:hypothetical protein
MSNKDATAVLLGLMDDAEWRERQPERWRERRKSIPEDVRSARDKYGDNKRERARQLVAEGFGGMTMTSTGQFLVMLPNAAIAVQHVLDRWGVTVYRSLFHERLMIIDGGMVRALKDADVRSVWAAVQLIGRGLHWAAAGFVDTLLRWNPKPEVVDEDEAAVHSRVQAGGGKAGAGTGSHGGAGRTRPGGSRERIAQVGA